MKILLVTIVLIVIILVYVYLKMVNAVEDIERLDQDGAFYYGHYIKNYHSFIYDLAFIFMRSPGCSAFMCKNEQGDVITGRNYDFEHLDDKHNITGLNMCLRIDKHVKYASLNGVDVVWLQMLKAPFYKGYLDNPKVNKLPLALLPYLTMDGINEMGLTVSILALDHKEGEALTNLSCNGKKKIIINQLVRKMLDECADVQEAIALTKQYALVSMLGYEYHLFISDASGKSIVMETRHQQLYIIESDACTNFYQNENDGCDCYYGSDLKEKFIKPQKTIKDYNYGYGHGYGRFIGVVEELDKHNKDGVVVMKDEEAMQTLAKVAQDYDGMLTSYTQYSVVYNNSKKSATYCVQQDYEHRYEFKL